CVFIQMVIIIIIIITMIKRSRYSGNCLDIYGETGPNVDEYPCKDPSSSDAANQQWIWIHNETQLQSKYNSEWCLTASNIFTFAYVYNGSSSDHVTFLVNTHPSQDYVLEWNGIEYWLPNSSVSIVDSEGSELFNTAKVDSAGLPTSRVYRVIVDGQTDLHWQSWTELVPLQDNPQHRSDAAIVNKNGPLEQIRLGNESSEYMYYTTIFEIFANDTNGIVSSMLSWDARMANAYLVFIDNVFVAQSFNYDHGQGSVFAQADTSKANDLLQNNTSHKHVLTILSSSLGVDNGINNMQGPQAQDKGLVGSVLLTLHFNDNHRAVYSLTNQSWSHWIGSTGENLQVHFFFFFFGDIVITTFSIPDNVKSEGVLLIDIGSQTFPGMRRGHFWLNGLDMGHYNNIILGDLPVQRYYFVPYDYVNIGANSINSLVFAEELPNVNPQNINIV
ncbi:beta-galactosidase, partial [Reticulomyxa filosa]